MNTPTDHYAPSAYQSSSADALPAPIGTGSRNYAFSTQLSFGHYAELESAVEITAQLEAEEHKLHEHHQKKTKNLKSIAMHNVGAFKILEKSHIYFSY